MLNLTSSIAVPNIARLRVTRVVIDDVGLFSDITLEAYSSVATGLVYGRYTLTVSDTLGQRLIKNLSPANYSDALQVTNRVSTPLAYSHILTALTQSNPYNRVELLGVADGWLDPALAGT